jgi:hypothetical protein
VKEGLKKADQKLLFQGQPSEVNINPKIPVMSTAEIIARSE